MQTLTRAALLTIAMTASPARALDCEAGFWAFTHWEGAQTCVPDNPQRIVTLQDQNALLPIMELGLTPVGSAGLALGEGGYEFRALQDYDTSMVSYVGPYWPGPDVEAVAALEPDVIVANPYIDNIAQFEAIAPTVQLSPSDTPFREALYQFAALVGKTERARELEAEFETAAARLQSELGEKLTTTTVSLLEFWDGEISTPPNQQSLGLAVPGLGMVRTAFEQTVDDWITISPEQLGSNPADIMILIAVPENQSGTEDTAFADFMAVPVVNATEVAKAGQIFAVHPRRIYGTSWRQAIDAMEAFAEIIAQDDINRDLVME